MVDHDYIVNSLKNQREKLLRDYGEDGFVSNVNLLEISIISLCNRLANMGDVESESFRSGVAVVATGDFGRGFLGVSQEVPLLFLVEESFNLKHEWFEAVVKPLMEAGWSIKGDILTLSEVQKRLESDWVFLREVMSLRYVSGNRLIVEDLEERLKRWFKEQKDSKIGIFKQSWADRLEAALQADEWLEPDIANFSGGLEDIRCIRIGLAFLGIWSTDEAVHQGVLQREDVDSLNQIEKFYLRLLNAGGTSHLSYFLQEEVAEKLGYTGKAAFSSVEVMMKEVYRSFTVVSRIGQLFWRGIDLASAGPQDGTSLREISKGVFIREGSLDVDFDDYPLDPLNFLKIFRIAAQYGVPVGVKTLRHLINEKSLLGSSAGDRGVCEEFLHMIHADTYNLLVFRQFHDMGFLEALVPEWANMVGLNQHDLFHVVPFHEHSIRTLKQVKHILEGHCAGIEPELTKVGGRISDPRWLYLAALLHDIGKSGGKDHALKGGEMIPPIAKRLGLLPEESDMVQFLVAQHTLLMDSASMRDIGDEGMLSQCTLIIGNPVRLDYLLVLTFADLRSTGPRAFEKWQRSPIMFLYERLAQIIEKGEPSPSLIRDRIAHIKELVKEKVSDLMDENQLQNQLEEIAPRYLLAMTPEEIAAHLRLEWSFFNYEEPFVFDVAESSLGKYQKSVKGWNITFVSEMAQGLLYKVAGILTLNNVDITAAQVFVKKNGIMILSIQCISRTLEEEVNWENVKSDLKKLLNRQISLDYRLAIRAVFPRTSRVSKSNVVLDNDSSDDYTILEIYTEDRPGLLYLIAKVLASFDIKIYVAKITTRGNRVADVFYVKDHLGNKLKDDEQIVEIKNSIVFWLDNATITP